MSKIFVTQKLVDGGIDPLLASGHQIEVRDSSDPIRATELIDQAHDADAIICLLNDPITKDVFDALVNLKVVGTVAVGHDNIDLAEARRHEVAVVNTPGVLDASTADVAILLMLAALRRSSDAERTLRTGQWTGWDLGDNVGRDMTGASLGLVGFGRIARAVAQRAHGFSMTVLHHTRTPTGDEGWSASLHEMAAQVDVLSIHVPHTESTTNLIDDAVLRALRPTSVVINTARGPVLDEIALASALEEGRLYGAGLDVYQGEPSIDPALLRAPHTVLLPHIGSSTVATRLAMCHLAIRGVLDVLEGRAPSNLV